MVRNYFAPNFTTEDFRIQVRGHPADYVYCCHATPVTRGALGYLSYQKGIIQGHFVHRYATRNAPSLCSRVVFRAVLSLNAGTQTVFQCYMSVKYTLRGYFWFFWCPCYALVFMSTDEISIRFFNPSSVIDIRTHVKSSTPANICGLIQTFKYQ